MGRAKLKLTTKIGSYSIFSKVPSNRRKALLVILLEKAEIGQVY